MKLRVPTALALLIGALVIGVLLAEVARGATCRIVQASATTGALYAEGLERLPPKDWYSLVVTGPGGFVNEGVRLPGEEVPLPFNLRGPGAYEGHVSRVHPIGEIEPPLGPRVEKADELATCTLTF